MFLTTFEGFKGHNISVSFFYSASQLAQSLGELVSVRRTADIWKDSLLWSKYCHTHGASLQGVKVLSAQRMATYKKMLQQMSVCCGQSFVKVNVKLLLFSAQFPC